VKRTDTEVITMQFAAEILAERLQRITKVATDALVVLVGDEIGNPVIPEVRKRVIDALFDVLPADELPPKERLWTYQDADAVLAVPNPELDRLRKDLSDARDRLASARQFRENEEWFQRLNDEKIRLAADKAHVEAQLAEAKRANAKLALTVSEVTDAWETDKRKIEDLSARFTGVKIHALRLRDRITDPETVKVLDELFGALTNPPPGDTP
jgi:hypothetical protein